MNPVLDTYGAEVLSHKQTDKGNIIGIGIHFPGQVRPCVIYEDPSGGRPAGGGATTFHFYRICVTAIF